jgi:hypothetical protein
MKVKKEYLILAVIIITAGLYLAFHKTDRTQYKLPDISKIEIDDITRMEITARGNAVALGKKGTEWFIAPQGYPADGAKIKRMLFEIEEIVITDLVSESKAYARYQLDDEKKITVRAWAKDKLQREFDIGKEAATYQHTFIRLSGDLNVYHARGDFRRKFDHNADELRDREVLAFDPDTVKSIRVTVGQDTLEMTRKETSSEDSQEAEKEGKQPTGPPKPVWLAADGQEVDSSALDSFLSSINNLMCENYLEGRQKAEFKNSIFEISLEGEQAYTLSIFKKAAEKDEELPAISSFNAYPFTLSSGKLDRLKKTVARLSGKKEAPKEK